MVTGRSANGGCVTTPSAPERTAIVGRESEVFRLGAAWGAAVRGRPSLVLITGEAGIGKTRVAAETVRLAGDTGGVVLSARCQEAERSLLLQPFVEAIGHQAAHLAPDLLRRLAGQRAATLAALVPRVASVLGPVLAVPASRALRRRLADEAVTAFLYALAEHQPVLLLLDDLHNAGSATVRLLRELTRGAGIRLLVVATVRTAQADALPKADAALLKTDTALPKADAALLKTDTALPKADAALLKTDTALPKADAALLKTDAALLKSHAALPKADAVLESLADVATRLTLGPLPPAAVTRLVTEAGWADLAGDIRDRTRGHPLFVVESLRSLAAGTTGVPESLEAAILARLRGVGEDTEQVLRAAAVLGATVDPATLARLVDLPLQQTAGHCEAALSAGLLTPADDGYEFAHDVVREVLYLTTPAAARTVHHTRAAGLLDHRPEALAAHAAAVEDWARAARGWLLAGEDAAGHLAVTDAQALLTQAAEAAYRAGDVEVGALAQARLREIG